ncbi:MAG TPA: hypothetical protein VGR69_05030 [Candidatus Rubrimentiphilum sp.]|nr:hypothetical protein [Candidatus Rubrimentiphilum sp.]
MPDAYVFPGGTVTEADLSERAFARTVGIDEPRLREQFRARTAPEMNVPLPSPREAAGLLIAALRELYEEAGVLLATQPVKAIPSSRTPFLELLEQTNLWGDAQRLVFFSQWLTPPQFAQRYNTHFFLARANPDETATADTLETHDGLWMTPGDALDRFAGGGLALVYPTIKHLERLTAFGTIEELFAFARSKPILAITPNTTDTGFALPAELEGAW